MKHCILALSFLMLCACTEKNSNRAPDDDAQEDSGLKPDGSTPDDESDAGVDAGGMEASSKLPRPPGALPRPPLDGELPSELRPPFSD